MRSKQYTVAASIAGIDAVVSKYRAILADGLLTGPCFIGTTFFTLGLGDVVPWSPMASLFVALDAK